MKPLEILFESRRRRRESALPRPLARLYGGPLDVRAGSVVANFVASLDGVVSVAGGSSGARISGGSQADRFVMGLLRARADAVLVGAGTFRADPGHEWTPEHVFPGARRAFAEYRRRMRLAPRPVLVIVTASGDIDCAHPALREPACIITRTRVAPRLRARLPSTAVVKSLGRSFSAARVLEAMRAEGWRTILSEGGPHMVGELLRDGLLDEVFLTMSPVLAGRGPGTLSLVEGVDLFRRAGVRVALRDVRRDGSMLFTRYQTIR